MAMTDDEAPVLPGADEMDASIRLITDNATRIMTWNHDQALAS